MTFSARSIHSGFKEVPMDRFLRAMSHDPAIEICFISQIISMVINSMIDFSQPLFPALWEGAELAPGKVIVIGADRDRAAAIQRCGIITRWTEFGELRICTG